MPLKPPKRIPARFNRKPSKLISSVVKRKHPMLVRRKTERVRNVVKRRSSKIGKIVIAEVRMWIILLVSVSCIIGFVTIVFSPYLSIKQITVRRQDARLDIEEIQKTLSPLFGHRLFLVTSGQVNSILTQSFPDVVSASISKQYPSTLTVSLKLDPLIARLKIDEPEGGFPLAASGSTTGTGSIQPQSQTLSGTFAFLTSKGFVILSPIDITHTTLPTFRIRDIAALPQHRSLLLDPAFIELIFEARKTLYDAFELTTSDIIVYVRAREFHLTARKISFWFDAANPLTEQFDRLREFLRTVSLQSVKEYIDLRLSDRVVYK